MIHIRSLIINISERMFFYGGILMQLSIENINFNNLDKNLEHLSKEQILEVIKKYYKDEKIKDILEEYEIPVTPSRLVRIFPTRFVNEECEKCGAQLVVNFESKTNNYMNSKQPYCTECGHSRDAIVCNCTSCKEERMEAHLKAEALRKKAKQEKKEIITNALKGHEEPEILEWNLTEEDRLYISVILRAALSEDMSVIEPLNTVERSRSIAPTEKLQTEIINTLSARDILNVSLKSELDAFDVTVDEIGRNRISYQIYAVKYELNIIPEDGNYSAMIKRLMYPDPELFDEEFCYEMWRKVALNESEQYLLYEMDKVGYNFSPGEKTYRVLEYLLDHFSTAQIYNIIYRAVANSTRRYQAREITKIHAQNSVITSCEKQGEKAVAENWSLKPYGRRSDLPESIISEVLFNSIMQISSLGFSEKPTKNFR